MSLVFVFVAFCYLFCGVKGGEDCNGMLKGMHINDDLEVGKMGCSLMDTHIKGNLKSGAEIGGTTSLTRSTVDGIAFEQSHGTVSIDESVIKPNGLKLHDCSSTLKLCGTAVADVVEFISCKGNFLLKNEGGCSGNEIYKDVKIQEIEGDVEIVGNRIKGEGAVVIEEVDGNVNIKNAGFNELVIKKVSGFIKLENVQATSVFIDDNSAKNIVVQNSNIEVLDCQSNDAKPKCFSNNIGDGKSECLNC